MRKIILLLLVLCICGCVVPMTPDGEIFRVTIVRKAYSAPHTYLMPAGKTFIPLTSRASWELVVGISTNCCNVVEVSKSLYESVEAGDTMEATWNHGYLVLLNERRVE